MPPRKDRAQGVRILAFVKICSLISILAIVCSCEDVSIKEAGLEELSILKFSDSNEMLSYFHAVAKQAPLAARMLTNRDNSFESFRQVYLRAIDELSVAKSEDEHKSLLIFYDDILYLKDNEYIPKIGNPFYQLICNRAGVYESEGYLHRVVNSNTIVFTHKANKSKLLGLKSLEDLDKNIFNLATFSDTGEYTPLGGRVSASCGANLTANYFDNHSKCSDDRRVYVTYFAISGYNYTPSAITEAWGEIRNWLCNWKIYDTVVRTERCSFTATATINGTNLNLLQSFTDTEVDSGSLILYNGPLSLPIYWQGGSVPSIQFTKIHEEATSRGVGYKINWAILDCQ